MIPAGLVAAVVTALGYGITPVCARRAVRLLGFVRANAARLLVALVVLGAIAFATGRGLGTQLPAFVLAGAIGFGIGGLAMFRALPLLGAPLASLLVETLAAFTAAVLAWVWFADELTAPVIAASLVILVGVALGLAPYLRGAGRGPGVRLGVGLAVLAAVAQGGSAVISRRALLAIQKATPVPGGPSHSLAYVSSAAFDRLIGGFAVAVLVLIGVHLAARRGAAARQALVPAGAFAPAPVPARSELGRFGSRLPDSPWFWVGANALFGPILGVTAMVWALQSLQPGVVQAVAAMAPLIAIPVARWLEGYRPPRAYYLGAVVAVAGLVALALAQG
ncbi:MAG: DMT family transporter [Cellulomonas sp.]|nr:DMT family transporter [Cellulomonas sp.]